MKSISIFLLLVTLVLSACGGPGEFTEPQIAVKVYLDGKVSGDAEATKRAVSKISPPAFDMAEGVDFPPGKDSGYASYTLKAPARDTTGFTVDAEIVFKDGTKANRRFFIADEDGQFHITNYAWVP